MRSYNTQPEKVLSTKVTVGDIGKVVTKAIKFVYLPSSKVPVQKLFPAK